MKVRTFSVVAGTTACNAKCPFCVSKMTPILGINDQLINKRNLKIACRLADKAGVNTALITGKGEPTLYPELITTYLTELSSYFPLIELQTNGLRLADKAFDGYLYQWYKLGLTTISISVVHHRYSINKAIYCGRGNTPYMDLPKLIRKLHSVGFGVRLSVVALAGAVDSPQEIGSMISFAKKHEVDQLTIRPMTAAAHNGDPKVTRWVKRFSIADGWSDIVAKTLRYLQPTPTLVRKLIHGAEVYDIAGQNVCFTNCLTLDTDDDELRQLIFFPDGVVTHDWNYKGARLL